MNEETSEQQLLTWEECREQIIKLGRFESTPDGKVHSSYKGFMGIFNSKKCTLLKKSVMHLTSSFPDDVLDKEKIYHILYNQKNYIDPKCKICGKRPSLRTISYGYQEHCSGLCAHKNKELSERMINTKLQRYGKKSTTNVEKCKKTKLERYGDPFYTNIEKSHRTYFERTGFKTPLDNPEVLESCKQTKFEVYGNENYNNREQADKTLVERYGSRSYRNHEKRTETLVSIYGSMYNAQEQQRNTCMQKYGVEYPLQSSEKRALADDTREILYGSKNFRNHSKRIQTLIDTIGSDWHTVIFKSYSKVSQDLFWKIYNQIPVECQKHTHFAELNDEYRVMYDNENRSNYFYDFCITSLKFIIEFDGTYWHSLGGVKEKDQHKQKVVEEKGFTMIRVDESDYNKDKQSIVDVCTNKILEMFESTNNCEMFEIKEGELV